MLCMLHVVRWASCVVCCAPPVVPVAWCTLSVVCCTLSVAWCTLSVVCCMLSVACCMLSVACCMLYAARCLLHAARCMLHAACCMLHAACCMLHAACCLLRAARCLLHAACCMLHAACCLLHAVCCLLHVACSMLSVACCTLYAAEMFSSLTDGDGPTARMPLNQRLSAQKQHGLIPAELLRKCAAVRAACRRLHVALHVACCALCVGFGSFTCLASCCASAFLTVTSAPRLSHICAGTRRHLDSPRVMLQAVSSAPTWIRRYIAYARKYVRPVLSDEAKRVLQTFYLELRKRCALRSSRHGVLRCNASCCVATCRAALQRVGLRCNVSCYDAT
jgi:hypothetical protein